MAFTGTVLEVVAKAARQLGLGTVSEVVGSTDENVLLLLSLLGSEGRDLIKEESWLQQEAEHTWTTDGSATYALPSGFVRMKEGSAWNRTKRLPLQTIDAADWQGLTAHSVNPTDGLLIRPRNGTFSIWPTTSTGESYGFEYLSSLWLQSNGAGSADLDEPAADDDTVLLDEELMVKRLKWAFHRDRGFDTSGSLDAYQKALEIERGVNAAMPKRLNLSGPRGGEPARAAGAVSAAGSLYILGR